MPEDSSPWVWVDLEMTGLDPATCVILEVAVVVTDTELRELDRFEAVLSATPAELDRMVPVVREMHHKSGLTERVRQARTTCAEAEQHLLDVVRRHAAPGTAVLCGNSVWQDRRFLARYLPAFLDYLHYRIVDVSSLKVLVKAWLPARAFDKGDKAHTAMADIRASIAELAYYRRLLFSVGAS